MFPNHLHIDSPEGRGKVELKHESGGTLSYGLGNSEDGLKAFNDNIQSISVFNDETKTWEVIYHK